MDIRPLGIRWIRKLRGPSYWHPAAAIACAVDLGALEGVAADQIPGFPGQWQGLMHSLRAHPLARGRELSVPLDSAESLPPLLAWLAGELQTIVGCKVPFASARLDADTGEWLLLVGYEEEAVGVQSLHDAVELVGDCLMQGAPDPGPILDRLVTLHERVRPGASAMVIVAEARRRGIPVRRLPDETIVQFGMGKMLRRIQGPLTDRTSVLATDLVQDKARTKRLLARLGLPVPEGRDAASVEEAVAIAREIGFPLLLKPLDAHSGRGITGPIESEDGVTAGWYRAAALSERVLVERYVAARDHRVLVVGGKVIAVTERVPAHVVGDGRSTIEELIDEANRDLRRAIGFPPTLGRLPRDALTEEFLASSKRSLRSVPPAGEVVYLRPTANLSTGGISIDRTDEIHPDNVVRCELLAERVGLDIAGIDVLTPDISIPFHENGAAFVEVNASPGIRMHTDPVEGKPRDVTAAILDMLYPPGTPATIPIIAVAGGGEKAFLIQLLGHLLRPTGKGIGWSVGDGAYLDGCRIVEQSRTPVPCAELLLADSRLEVAVVEVGEEEAIERGLLFDGCDMAIIGTADAGPRPPIRSAERVVAGVVRAGGHLLLDANDPFAQEWRGMTRATVVPVSARSERNPLVEELAAGSGIAAVLDRGVLTLLDGQESLPVASLDELGQGGELARDILSAIAAAYLRGVPVHQIREELHAFFIDK